MRLAEKLDWKRLIHLYLNSETNKSVKMFLTREEIISQISCTLRLSENLHYNTDPNFMFLLYR
jgi:hypothetical protein